VRLSLQPSTISVVTSNYDDNYFRLLQFTSSKKKNDIIMNSKNIKHSFKQKGDLHWKDQRTKQEFFIAYPVSHLVHFYCNF